MTDKRIELEADDRGCLFAALVAAITVAIFLAIGLGGSWPLAFAYVGIKGIVVLATLMRYTKTKGKP